MVKLFVLVLLMILHTSQLALSEDKDRQRCSRNCTLCHKDSPNCPGITCSHPGNCTTLTPDSCGCCLICAKLEGESCGGLYGAEGFCEKRLRCSVSENRALSGKISAIGVCKGKLFIVLCVAMLPSIFELYD